MVRVGSALTLTVLLLATACGGGSSPRQLQSISISAAAANNAVQFIATGHYNQAPTTLSPLPVFWSIPLLDNDPGPTITQDGIAQCTSGVPGTFSVLAYAPADPSIPIEELLKADKVVLGTSSITCQ